MLPSIASIMFVIVVLTIVKIDWNLCNSWNKKIFRGIVSFFPGSPSPLGPLNTLSLSKTSIKFKSGGS